jgi:hypothetical protein
MRHYGLADQPQPLQPGPGAMATLHQALAAYQGTIKASD